MEKKTYVTTDRAGFVVASRRIPASVADGGAPRPTVGFEIELTDAEAEYELAQETIVLKSVTSLLARRADASQPAAQKSLKAE